MTPKVIVVVGAQWGDEGKGKVVNKIAEEADLVIRDGGGGNAGHTIFVKDRKVVQHLLPCGIVYKDKINMVGPRVVCDLEVLEKELALAKEFGSEVWLDERAPIVLPIHKAIDAGRETSGGASKIGTTGRGIGPCYEDWVARRGLRLGDLRSRQKMTGALEARGFYAERRAVASHHDMTSVPIEAVLDWAEMYAKSVVPHLADTLELVHDALDRESTVAFELAQGVMLDVQHGTWPFVTSSSCGAGAVHNTFGIKHIHRAIGVSKAYVTRVGSGPFPTEIPGLDGDWLRDRGDEFGATTGRPRRCGWLDLPALKYACRVGLITELVITKLDVLTGRPSIPVCKTYVPRNGTLRATSTLTRELLESVEPSYVEMEGWNQDLRHCRQFADLPHQARHFLSVIERTVGLPITGVSVGPGRDDMIWVD